MDCQCHDNSISFNFRSFFPVHWTGAIEKLPLMASDTKTPPSSLLDLGERVKNMGLEFQVVRTIEDFFFFEKHF